MLDSWWTPFFTKAKAHTTHPTTRRTTHHTTRQTTRQTTRHGTCRIRDPWDCNWTRYGTCRNVLLEDEVIPKRYLVIRIRRSFFFAKFVDGHSMSQFPMERQKALVMVQVLPASSMPPASPQERDRAGNITRQRQVRHPTRDPLSAVRSHCERSCEEMRTDANSVPSGNLT